MGAIAPVAPMWVRHCFVPLISDNCSLNVYYAPLRPMPWVTAHACCFCRFVVITAITYFFVVYRTLGTLHSVCIPCLLCRVYFRTKWPLTAVFGVMVHLSLKCVRHGHTSLKVRGHGQTYGCLPGYRASLPTYQWQIRLRLYIGWQWRNFVPYLCQLVFAAIL